MQAEGLDSIESLKMFSFVGLKVNRGPRKRSAKEKEKPVGEAASNQFSTVTISGPVALCLIATR